jgi:putative effector of murein hydrolase
MVMAFIGLYKVFQRLWIEPAFRALILLEAILFSFGIAFYHFIEGWGWLDSAYFCVVTLATVGYGDFAPVTQFGRLYTIFYIIIGVAMLGVFIQLAGKTAFTTMQDNIQRRQAEKSE